MVLPPLLYASAEELLLRDLRAVWRPVTILAFGLVLASVAAAGYVAVAVTGLPLAMAFVLGAVLASTDPVAVTALGRRLALPVRTLVGRVSWRCASFLCGARMAPRRGDTQQVWSGQLTPEPAVVLDLPGLLVATCTPLVTRQSARCSPPAESSAVTKAARFGSPARSNYTAPRCSRAPPLSPKQPAWPSTRPTGLHRPPLSCREPSAMSPEFQASHGQPELLDLTVCRELPNGRVAEDGPV
ncbi:cation:proton antiporter domain-containing protein [Kitasatospora aureofaciens]